MNQGLRSISTLARLYGRLGTPGACYLTAGVYAIAISVLTLGMVFFGRDAVSLSPAAVGRLTAAFMLASLLANIASSLFHRRVTPLPTVIASALAIGALTGCLALTRQPALLLLLFALCGVATGLFWPALAAWLTAGREGAALGHAVSLYNVSWSIGGVIGPPACGWLAERSVSLPILVSAGCFLLTGLFLAGARRHLAAAEPAGRAPDAARPAEGHPLTDTPLRYAGWLGGFAVFTVMGVLGYIFPMAAREQMGLSESLVGWLLLWRTVCNLGVFMILSRTIFWHFRLTLIVAGPVLGAGICFAFMGARTPVWNGLLFFAFGISTALAYANSQFLGVVGSPHRARRMAIHESGISGGLMLGALAGGWLYEAYGMTRLYSLCGACLLLCAAVQAVWGGRAGPARPAR